MSKERRVTQFLFDAVFDNFWLKLISLIFALGFYAFIHSAQTAQRVIRVKLVIEKPPENVPRRLMTDIPPTVDVTVVGPSGALEGLSEDAYSITLNLQAAQSIAELKLLPEMISPDLPPRMEVDRIYPSRLQIKFEDVVSRMIQVQVARTGQPGSGMEERGSPVLDPREVQATGIESVVSTIQFARAEPFDVSGLMEGKHTRRLRLLAPPEGVVWDQDSISATLTIERKLKTRDFDNLKVEVLGMPRATTTPAVVHIFVSGPADVVDELRTEAIVPRVEPNLAALDLKEPGSANMHVIVDLPPELDIKISPPDVLVKW